MDMEESKAKIPWGSMATDWEKRVDLLLQINNERLVLQLQQLVSSIRTPPRSSNETAVDTPEMTQGGSLISYDFVDDHSVSDDLGDPPDPSTNKRTRFSVSSLDTRGEILHKEILRKSHTAQYVKSKFSSNSMLSTGLRSIRSIAVSWTFEALSALAILTHSVYIGVEVQYGAHHCGILPISFFIVEQIYTLIFLMEFLLRILSERNKFFWSSPNIAWNYLDLVLNIASVVNLVALVSIHLQDMRSDAFRASANIRIIRILRLARVIRVVRIVRIVRFIRALRSLVHSIFGTMKVLLWSVLLLFMIMYVFAIVFTDISNAYAHVDSAEDDNVTFLRRYFEDLERSILTLFQSITGGLDWGIVANDLHHFAWGWGYVYIFYVAFCLFAVLNVMTAMFCQSASEAAEQDQELQIQAVIRTKQQQVEMFMSIFKMLQCDPRSGDGKLSFTDFERLFERPDIRSFFQAVDVEAKDAWTFFKLMDVSGDGELDASDFVDACMRLKGTARSMDVSLVLQEQRRLRKKILSMHHMLSELRGHPQPVMTPRERISSSAAEAAGHVSI